MGAKYTLGHSTGENPHRSPIERKLPSQKGADFKWGLVRICRNVQETGKLSVATARVAVEVG